MSSVASPTSAARRQSWVDVARGLGIILVVWGHVLRANVDLQAAPWAAEQDRWIYAFHMPLFFILAGLFLWTGVARGRVAFLRGRWWAVIWPYLLWSTVIGLVEVAASQFVNSPIGIGEILRIPITPIEQYWFLYALLVCQLVCVLAFPSVARLWLLAAIGVAICIAAQSSWIGLRAMLYLPFVVAGVTGAQALSQLAGARATIQLAASVVGWAVLAAMLTLVSGYEQNLMFRTIAGLSGGLGIIGLAAFFARFHGQLIRLLIFLGQASLAIFVLHTLFSAGSRIALKLAGIAADHPINITVSMLAGVIFPWAIYQFALSLGLTHSLGLGGSRPHPLPVREGGMFWK